MDLSEVTVVILSRGREKELSKTLEFWARTNISVLVLHNTEEPLQSVVNVPNLKYVVARVPYGERCGLVGKYLNTEYAILCSDDEVYIPSALARMKALLEQESKLMSVGGLTVAVGKYGPITTGNFSYSKMRGYANTESQPLQRLNHHFDRNHGYRNGAIYRLMRKDLMVSTMNLFYLLRNFSTPYIYEVTGEIFVNSQGMTKYIDNVYWLRNWINKPVGHKHWDRKLYFMDWASQVEQIEQFYSWKKITEKAIGLSSNDFEKVLAMVIEIRKESELSEIMQESRKRVSIPENLKWLIRISLKPGSLPKNLDETLDNLQQAGVVVDRAAIYDALPALSKRGKLLARIPIDFAQLSDYKKTI